MTTIAEAPRWTVFVLHHWLSASYRVEVDPLLDPDTPHEPPAASDYAEAKIQRVRAYPPPEWPIEGYYRLWVPAPGHGGRTAGLLIEEVVSQDQPLYGTDQRWRYRWLMGSIESREEDHIFVIANPRSDGVAYRTMWDAVGIAAAVLRRFGLDWRPQQLARWDQEHYLAYQAVKRRQAGEEARQ